MPIERLIAQGHEHVTATHESTLEVTTDDWLTPAGDCIVGIEADRAPAQFDEAFVATASCEDARITMDLAVAGHQVSVTGRGDPRLSFASDRCLVARTSRHIDDRTVMIDADTAARDIGGDLVDALKRGAELSVTLRVGPAIDGG